MYSSQIMYHGYAPSGIGDHSRFCLSCVDPFHGRIQDGVFRVKNHDFTPKNLIFSNFRGARAGCAAPAFGFLCSQALKSVGFQII